MSKVIDSGIGSLLSRRGGAARRPQRAATGRGRGRNALVTAGVLGAIAAGGAAFFRRRRPAFPPVASEPPRVRPTGEAPQGTAPTDPREN